MSAVVAKDVRNNTSLHANNSIYSLIIALVTAGQESTSEILLFKYTTHSCAYSKSFPFSSCSISFCWRRLFRVTLSSSFACSFRFSSSFSALFLRNFSSIPCSFCSNYFNAWRFSSRSRLDLVGSIVNSSVVSDPLPLLFINKICI